MDSDTKKKFWALKPSWCQPWSIITFGIFLIATSWIILNNIIITSIVIFFISAWWILFLVFAPTLYQENFSEDE